MLAVVRPLTTEGCNCLGREFRLFVLPYGLTLGCMTLGELRVALVYSTEQGVGSHDADVVVVEEIWGEAFDELATRYKVLKRPTAYLDRDELFSVISTARGVVVRNQTLVDRAFFEAAKHLCVIGRAGVGLDNIDLNAADEFGIVVVAALGANARSVAEHSLGLALALMRNITQCDHATKAGNWDRIIGRELYGKTWGVVGMGATGSSVAKLVQLVGMNVVGYDPYVPTGNVSIGFDERLEDLSQLLAVSDIVSLHLPMVAETQRMVNAEFLSHMKFRSCLINVSRGGLVDEGALLTALGNGNLYGAALDVRATEPPKVGALEVHPNVILTPHVAGLTEESQIRVTDLLASEIELVLEGGKATKAVGSHRRWQGSH